MRNTLIHLYALSRVSVSWGFMVLGFETGEELVESVVVRGPNVVR